MMKKIILAVLPVVIILAAIIVGIFTNQEESSLSKKINMYFLNEDASSIVSEEQEISHNSKDDLIKLVTEGLLKGPKTRKTQAISGKGTKLLDTYLEGVNLTVNFSKEFLREEQNKNMLSVYAVIRTLCQIDRVANVLVTVEGKPVTAADGSVIGFMSNSDINLESDTYTTDSKNIILYFADKDLKNLVREVRTIKITDTRPIESYVISELIKGPVNKDLSATLTSDTELISAETTNETCHVTFKNFIEKNLTSPSNDKNTLAVYSVVNSLTALEGVTSVRFLFEGKTGEMIGGFDFSTVFMENKGIIKN